MPSDTSAARSARGGDEFTIEKLKWLRQVAGDPELPPQAARLAIILACSYVNRDSREAWPSMTTLERDLAVKESAVRRGINSLVAAGHLTVKVGGGRNISSRYRWIIRRENTFDSEGVSKEKPLRERKGFGENPSVRDRETPSKSKLNPSVSEEETPPKTKGEPFDTEPDDEPIGEPAQARRSPPSQTVQATAAVPPRRLHRL